MQQVEVHIRGHIDRDWSDWLEGLAVAHTENGETILTGSLRDQSALLGLVNSLSNLGLRILSVALKEVLPQSHKGASKM